MCLVSTQNIQNGKLFPSNKIILSLSLHPWKIQVLKDLDKHASRAASIRKSHKKMFQRLKQENSQEIDHRFIKNHQAVFAQTNCLSCANCCKTTGPLFTSKDIERIARFLKIRPAEMVETYLRVDEDQDYVVKKTPCVFLGPDNDCSIYTIRPKACREYPHTDRIKQKQLFGVTLKNASICPAVYEILERIREKIT